MSGVPVSDESHGAAAPKLVPYEHRQRAASPLFDLDETLVSPAALEALAAHGMVADVVFARHASGDWGSLRSSTVRATRSRLPMVSRAFRSSRSTHSRAETG